MKGELAGRPTVVAFLGLCAGVSSGFNPWNALVALVLVPALWRSKALIVLAFATGLGLWIRPEPSPAIVVPGGVFDGVARVVTVPQTVRSGISSIVEGRGSHYRLVLPAGADVSMGDELRLRADIAALPQRAVRQHLEVAVLRPTGPVAVVREGFPAWRWALGFRRSFLSFLEAHADPVLVGLVDALCVNVTGDLGPQLYDDLRRSGTIHIVSASGLNVAIMSVLFAWLLLVSPLPRWAQLSVLTFGLFLYAAAAGFHGRFWWS